MVECYPLHPYLFMSIAYIVRISKFFDELADRPGCDLIRMDSATIY